MKITSNLTLNQKFLNFIFIMLPIAYVVGNFAINLMTVLIISSAFFAFDNELKKKENKKILIYLLIFFILLVVSTLIEKLLYSENNNIIKSLLFLRYFILTFVLVNIIKKLNINLRYFLISCLTCSLLLSIDVIFQSIVGKDIFGFTSFGSHNSGFLGSELNAGSYIKRFFFLGVFAIPLISKNKNKFNILFLIALLICFFGIVLSGNRMPVLLFLLFIFLFFLLVKNFKYELIAAFLISILSYQALLSTNDSLKESYISFKSNIVAISKIIFEINEKFPELEKNKGTVFYQRYNNEFNNEQKAKYKNKIRFGSGHRIVFLTAIDTFNDSPILGSGINSFRIKCKDKLHLPTRLCQNHPHNYYLDILNAVGLVGLIVLLSALYYIYLKRNLIVMKLSAENYYIYNAIFISLIVELFPLQSSGSFFSTLNASYIFLLLGLILNFNFNKIKK